MEWRFCMRPSVLTYDVTFLRHVTSNKMNNFEKNVFLQIVKVKGQTQGQGQIKVKGQGHLPLFDAQQWKVLMSACHCLTHNNGNVNHSPYMYRHVNHSLCGECPYILG